MNVLLFWILLFLIFYTYIGYFFFIFIVSLFIKRKVKKETGFTPLVSILIAAYNEEKNIREKIQNTLGLDYPKDKLEIIVISDGSTDRTDDIVSDFNNGRIVLYRVEGRLGKTEARNRAVKIARGEIIVFSDATTVYDKYAIKNLVRNFADPAVGAVSGRYDYIKTGKSSMSLANILYWRYENFIKSRQSEIKTLTGMSGCINSFRKGLYEPLPAHIIEDLVEPLKILEKGYRIVFEPEALAHELTTDTASQEFKMRVRVISQGITGILYMKKLFNPFKYGFVSFQLFSHKVLRWSMPFFLIGLFICNILILNEHPIYKILFFLQAIFYLFATLGYFFQRLFMKLKLFTLPLYFCTLNLASLIAVLKIFKGVKIHKWETVR